VQTVGGVAGSSSSFTLTQSVSTPVISSATAATGTVGSAFSYQIAATNGATAFGAAGLPAGLAVNAAGLISGVPTTLGTFPVTISAGNASGGASATTLALTILPHMAKVRIIGE
jgi:hypothetical protein